MAEWGPDIFCQNWAGVLVTRKEAAAALQRAAKDFGTRCRDGGMLHATLEQAAAIVGVPQYDLVAAAIEAYADRLPTSDEDPTLQACLATARATCRLLAARIRAGTL